MTRRILLADSRPDLRLALHSLLSSDQLPDTSAEVVETGRELLERLEADNGRRPDVVVLAQGLPDMDWVDVLRRVREMDPDLPVVMVSGADSLDMPVRAMQAGATDVLVRPVDEGELKKLVAPRRPKASDRCVALEVDPTTVEDQDVLLGRSPGMLDVFKTIGRVAPTSATVLITGESGTGKELIAGLIHGNSPRAGEAFQVVNCAAIPENLLETELFGHEKGAFTGADSRSIGKFESAEGGTLFLDEVGDMSRANQRKILRALEGRTIQRVGGTASIPIDVRVVAATHVDLWEQVKEGAFRRDLYYRLAVVNLLVPPLRDRGNDLRLLADYFIARFAAREGRPIRWVECEVYDRLAAYDWPGNVRELRNVIKRSVILGRGSLLSTEDLPDLPPTGQASGREREGGSLRHFCREGKSLEELERLYIANVLEEVDWHYARAAEILQVHRNTLRRKMRKYGMVGDSEDSSEAIGSSG